jgi:hypothetical protein
LQGHILSTAGDALVSIGIRCFILVAKFCILVTSKGYQKFLMQIPGCKKNIHQFLPQRMMWGQFRTLQLSLLDCREFFFFGSIFADSLMDCDIVHDMIVFFFQYFEV